MLSIFVERPSSPRHSSSNSPRWPRQKYPPLSELGNCIYDFDLTLWSYWKPLLEVRNLPRNENLSQWSRNLGLALKIVCNSRRGDTLRKHNRTSLNSPTNQELSGLPVLVLCEFDDGGVIHRSRKVVDVVSERAVSRYQNILQRVNSWIEMFEMLHNSTCFFDHSSNSGCCKYAWASIWFTAGGILALLNIRKILYQGRGTSSRGKKRFDLFPSEITDSNTSDLPFLYQLFHCFPRLSNRYINNRNLLGDRIHWKPLWRLGKRNRPMDQKQVEIIGLEIFKSDIKSRFDIFCFMICVPEFSCNLLRYQSGS